MPRKPSTHRIDGNQAAIVKVAESHGWQVLSLTSVGSGCPDLLLWRYPQGFRLVEVKTPKGKLTPAQERFRARYSMPVLYVRTEQQAADLFGAITNMVGEVSAV